MNKIINFRVTNKVYEEVKKISEKHFLTMSSAIKYLISIGLQKLMEERKDNNEKKT
jgi:antitoxin component of RelBE/YafQ-DinJ toxin-antitoxin module